ncbi:hypothetical protein LJC15_05085, partial [Desulfovibrio sp. OttesenSCG-928-G11]|nr:hypothetical protein [Desulfovibrio sp. OttesenSCG-928-G11]
MNERAPASVPARLAAGIMLSRLLGFGRDLLTAALLGPGADAFLAAFRLPNAFRRLLADGSLGLAFGAAGGRAAALYGQARAELFSRALAVRIFFLSCAACLLLLILARPLLFAIAPGLDGETARRAALYLRLCLPYAPLCLFCALAFALAAAKGRFNPQAMAPAILNAAMILAAALALVLYPAQAHNASLLLCLGLALGAFAQSALALRCLGGLAALIKAAPNLKDLLRRPLGSGEERAFLRGLPLSVLGAAPHQAHALAALFCASFAAPGVISALYFAERLVELPLGLAGAALGLALLPDITGPAARGDLKNCSQLLAVSLRLSAFFSLPAAAGLFALADPLTDLLFGRGAFDARATGLTAAALRGYALALPALCAARPMITVMQALDLTRSTAAAVLPGLVPLGLAGAAAAFMDLPVRQSALLGLGLAAGAWSNCLLLLRGLKKAGLPCPIKPVLADLARYALLALLMAVLLRLVPASGPALLALVVFCVLAWTLLHHLGGNPDAG